MNNDVYTRRINVESVISLIKRRFNGVNFNRNTHLQNKETKLQRCIISYYRAMQIF